MVSTGLSGGAWRTMTTEPKRHIAQPNLPSVPNRSFRIYEPRTALIWLLAMSPVTSHRTGERSYPIKTLSAPSGVTKIAGAKAYAAKLAISPMATIRNVSDSGFHIRGWLVPMSRAPYVRSHPPTKSDSSSMRILRLQSHVVRMHASNPRRSALALLSPRYRYPIVFHRSSSSPAGLILQPVNVGRRGRTNLFCNDETCA